MIKRKSLLTRFRDWDDYYKVAYIKKTIYFSKNFNYFIKS